MRIIPDRVVWTLWRRYRLRATLPHFWASPFSYCCPRTIFEGYHTIKTKTEIYLSKIGRFTYFAENVRAKHCQIGPFCSFGPDVILGDLPRHPTNLISTHPLFYSTHAVAGVVFSTNSSFEEYATTNIGADVFIGARALIMPGVRLGHGCIVGAGAIVTKDVPPYSIVVGVPAKVLRYRFSQEIIDRLLSIKWWTWPVKDIRMWQAEFAVPSEITIEKIESALLKNGRN